METRKIINSILFIILGLCVLYCCTKIYKNETQIKVLETQIEVQGNQIVTLVEQNLKLAEQDTFVQNYIEELLKTDIFILKNFD